MSVIPLVYVIVLNWNGWRDTCNCLASLRVSTYPNLHVVVVDNGSSDGSSERLTPLLQQPWGELVLVRRNLGFTGGANLGLRMSLERGADYAFLLNNDATVAPHGIATLVQAAEARREVGLAGPKIVWTAEPDRIWSAGISVSWRRAAITAHQNELDDGRFDERMPVQGLSGCALLVKRRVLEQVGLLDERYFAYYEDLDYCWRARRAGWGCLYVGDACATHRGSATSNRGAGGSQSALLNYYGARNGLLFVHTHAPRARRTLALSSMAMTLVAADVRVLAGGLLLRRPGAMARAQAIAAGAFDFVRGWFGARHEVSS